MSKKTVKAKNKAPSKKLKKRVVKKKDEVAPAAPEKAVESNEVESGTNVPETNETASQDVEKADKGLVHPVSGLKRRRVTEDEVKVVAKPRKMNLVKPKRQSTKVSNKANSSQLVFPTDRLGITSEVKAALIRAGSKIGSDDKVLALVEETVAICMEHIKARSKQNKQLPTLKQRVNTRPTQEV